MEVVQTGKSLTHNMQSLCEQKYFLLIKHLCKNCQKGMELHTCLHVAGIFAYHIFGGIKNFSFHFQTDTHMTKKNQRQ